MSPLASRKPLLVMGSRNYSSWSLRAWLFARSCAYEFEEHVIHFADPDYRSQIAALSSSGRVPLLIVGNTPIWDSLAICEFIAESTGRGLPRNILARAHCRSVAAEMHSSFAALREQCPMNVRAAQRHVPLTAELEGDVGRVDQLWSDCRRAFAGGGPWLFGEFSLADAMYSPVCFRFATYGAALSDASRAYLAHMLAAPAMLDWAEACRLEGHSLAEVDLVGQL